MNTRQFEIYEKNRKRKYEKDLADLQQEMASRGLTFSTIREQGENRLKQDYGDEVEMKKEESLLYTDELKETRQERRNSIWTNRILAAVGLVGPILTGITVYLTVIEPERSQRIAEEISKNNKIELLYRSIASNQVVYVDNYSRRLDLKDEMKFSDLPRKFLITEVDKSIEDVLQKKIGMINYQVLIYYYERTSLVNSLIDKMRLNLEDNKNVNAGQYLGVLEELEDESWKNTRFGYIRDTECLMHILREEFNFITDERNEKAFCTNESLNRIYYHFGYFEVDTPAWMKSRFREALKERGADAWWIQ